MHLDTPRLLIQWLVVVITVCGLLFFMNQEGDWQLSWEQIKEKIKRMVAAR